MVSFEHQLKMSESILKQ